MKTILELLSLIANAFITLGGNKGKKIDLQAEAIIAKAEKRAEKARIKTKKLRRKLIQEQWNSEIDLLKLKKPRKVRKVVEDILTAEGEIVSITGTEDSLLIKYTQDNKLKEITV